MTDLEKPGFSVHHIETGFLHLAVRSSQIEKPVFCRMRRITLPYRVRAICSGRHVSGFLLGCVTLSHGTGREGCVNVGVYASVTLLSYD